MSTELKYLTYRPSQFGSHQNEDFRSGQKWLTGPGRGHTVKTCCCGSQVRRWIAQEIREGPENVSFFLSPSRDLVHSLFTSADLLGNDRLRTFRHVVLKSDPIE